MSNDLKSIARSNGTKLSAIAAALGVDKSTVTRWAQTRVPAERCVEIERAVGIPRQEMRPDLFGASEIAA